MGYHIAMKMRYTLTQYNNKIILKWFGFSAFTAVTWGLVPG